MTWSQTALTDLHPLPSTCKNRLENVCDQWLVLSAPLAEHISVAWPDRAFARAGESSNVRRWCRKQHVRLPLGGGGTAVSSSVVTALWFRGGPDCV